MTNRKLLRIGAGIIGFIFLVNFAMLVIVLEDMRADREEGGIVGWLVGEFDDPGILTMLEGTSEPSIPVVSSFATFVRESTSPFGYPLFIALHTLGLSIVVGTSTLVAARVLGFAPSIPLQPLGSLFVLMWGGFVVNTISGSGLALATAAGQFTNPVLLVKFLCVEGAVMCMLWLQTSLFRGAEPTADATRLSRMVAGSLLSFWLLAMVAGRLVAYAGVIIGR